MGTRIYIKPKTNGFKKFYFIYGKILDFGWTLPLKPGKAPGPDSIYPKLINHNVAAVLKSWLRDLLSSCLQRLKVPKIWRRALVVVIPKPIKPVAPPKSYRPISLLCVLHKILERLI